MAIAKINPSDSAELSRKAIVVLRCANQSAPINRLPPELLSKIFSLVITGQSTTHKAIPARSFGFTHTCHRWRTVALATATLWATPDFSRPRWGEVMLGRSGSAALSMRVGSDRTPQDWSECMRPYPEEQTERLVVLALREVGRTRVLQLAQDAGTLSRLVRRLCDPAPILEELSLHVLHEEELFLRRPPEHGVIIPANAFQTHYPKLRKLSIALIENAWETRMIGVHLTSLSISDLPQASKEALPWDTVFDALERCEALQYLDLRQALPAHDFFSLPAATRLLSRLNNLVLVDRAPALRILLGTITPPSSAKLEISALDWVPDDAPIDAMRIRLRSLFISLFELLERTGNADTLHRLAVTAVQGVDDWDLFTLSADGWCLRLEHGEDISDSWGAFLDAVRSHSSWMVRLRSLRVSGDGALGAAEWEAAFGGACRLEKICVCGPQALGFLAALRKSLHVARGCSHPTGLFPCLRTLVLEDVDCAGAWNTSSVRERLSDLLLHVLAEMKAQGRRLQGVEVRACIGLERLVLEEIGRVVRSMT